MMFRPVSLTLAVLLLAGLAGCADPTAPLDVATTVAEDRPFGQVAQDTKIKLDFDRRLVAGDDRDLFFNLSSDVYEGRLMLTGSVRTERDRARAVALARGTSGVKVVYDELQVTEKGGFSRAANDALIEAKLKARLVGAKGIKSINYRWQVVNGVVYLIGRARNRAELDSVLAVVKDTRDVTSVVSHVEVGAPGK